MQQSAIPCEVAHAPVASAPPATVGMASLAIDIAGALLKTVVTAKEIWEQTHENDEVAQELVRFIDELQVNRKAFDSRQLGHSNSSAWTMAALKEDLDKAEQDADVILRKGFIHKLWNSYRIKQELQALRERIMTSFQVKLLFTTLNVAIDNRDNQREFLAAMSRVQAESARAQAETSASNLQQIKGVIRKELQHMWQAVQVEMQARGGEESVEGAIRVIKSTRQLPAQTDDTDKFFADVLMGLEHAMGTMHQRSNGGATSSRWPPSAAVAGGTNTTTPVDAAADTATTQPQQPEEQQQAAPGPPFPPSRSSSRKSSSPPSSLKWYHDPITWEVMCDPVKATDRRTYDRWTLLDHTSNACMRRSPFEPGQGAPLQVAFDDIDVRSRLFHKFPAQEAVWRARRQEYRERALARAGAGFVGDALAMLNHVLDWDSGDAECRAARDCILDDEHQQQQQEVTVPQSNDGTDGDDDESVASASEMSSWWWTTTDDDGGHEAAAAWMELETAGCDPARVAVSPDYLTLTSASDKPVSVRTASPCPPGAPFYFEVKVKDKTTTTGGGGVAVGFAAGTAFKPTALPGLCRGSWGYAGSPADGPVAGGTKSSSGTPTTLTVVKPSSGTTTLPAALRTGDTLGAGVLPRSRQLYFTHNGRLAGVVTLSGLDSAAAPLYAVVGMRDALGKVTVSFGGGGRRGQRAWVPRAVPARLDPATAHPRLTITSNLAQCAASGDDLDCAVRADAPAPCRGAGYYFEATVEAVGECVLVAVGFAAAGAFQDAVEPGFYSGSLAYCACDDLGAIYTGSLSDTAHPAAGGVPAPPSFGAGDTVGAGVVYDTDEVFFCKNGAVVGAAPRSAAVPGGVLYPALGMFGRGTAVRVNFGDAPFAPHDPGLPTGFFFPPPAAGSVDTPAVVAVRADRWVPLSGDFYFELDLLPYDSKTGRHQPQQDQQEVAVGFASAREWRRDAPPGRYAASCGYLADGSVYCGGRHEWDLPALAPGDTVGAGVSRRRDAVWFTRNGSRVARVAYRALFDTVLVYPMVAGLDDRAVRVRWCGSPGEVAARVAEFVGAESERGDGVERSCSGSAVGSGRREMEPPSPGRPVLSPRVVKRSGSIKALFGSFKSRP